MSWMGVITNAGISLLEQWERGDRKLIIDGAAVGSGVTAENYMRSAIGLKTPKDIASVVASKAIEGGTEFKIQVGPASAEIGAYTAHEVGLWGHLDDEESVMIALHQDKDGGIGVPLASVAPDFVFSIYLEHAISNNGNLVVNIDTDAYVSLSTMEEKIEELSSKMRDVPFAIGVDEWTLTGGVYKATFLTEYVTNSSRESVIYDSSIRTAARADIDAVKKTGGGGIVFTTEAIPVGILSGRLSVIDSLDGKIPVVLEDTVVPIANGGTGASNITGAKENLGFPAGGGSYDQVIRSNGDGTSRWDNAATQEEIGAAVTEWLGDNVPTGTTVVVDRSLSVDGAAADAKTTGQVKESIDKVNGWMADETGVRNYLFTKGAWIPTTTSSVNPESVSAESGAYCCVIDCQEGDEFTFNLSGCNSSHRPWSFIDANNNVLSQATSNSATNTTKVAPENAAKLVLNSKNANTYCYKGVSKIATAKLDIEHIVQGITNRFDKAKGTEGYRLRVSDKTAVASANFGITDYIPCRTGDIVYRNKHVDSASYGDVLYDINQKALLGVGSSNVFPYLVVPEGCEYVRCTYTLSTKDDFTVYVLSPSDFPIFSATNRALKTGFQTPEEELTALWTRGHVREYRNYNNYGFLYVEDNGEIRVGYIRPCTKRVRISSGDYVYIALRESTLTTQTLTINFYNSDGTLVWSYLNDTDENGRKNTYTSQQLMQKNGGLFSDIPNGYYVEVLSNYDVSLLVWDGKNIGIPATMYSSIFANTSTKESLPEDGGASLLVNGSAVFLIAKPGYTFLDVFQSSSSATSVPGDKAQRFPSQIISLQTLNYPSRNKNVTVVKNYDYSTGQYEKATPMDSTFDICYIEENSALGLMFPVGWAQRVREAIDNVFATSWECKKDLESSGSDTFKEGVTYDGIPYRSGYSTAHFFGWHITKHTFINAANDPDSIFYNNPSTSVPGPYYSLVCSIFASLVNRFPYPVTNYSMMHDPNVLVRKINQPAVGEILSNGSGHCMVPYGEGNNRVAIAESVGPITRRAIIMGTSPTSDWKGIGLDRTYLESYCYSCVHKTHSYVQYDIEAGTITNGSARPYKGDRCVFTSAEDVLINIKDNAANRLYYQKFSVSYQYGKPTSSFVAEDSPEYVPIESGETQVVLRSADVNNEHTGIELEDGAIYGVWASTDDSQATAPENVEYFEWHDVSNPVTFVVEDGILRITNDVDFWYVVTSGHNHADAYGGKTGGNWIIPKQTGIKDIDGNLLPNPYAKYGERAHLSSVRSVKTFFAKGKFGAYVISGEIHDEPDPDDPED